jgi:hypothetical protein
MTTPNLSSSSNEVVPPLFGPSVRTLFESHLSHLEIVKTNKRKLLDLKPVFETEVHAGGAATAEEFPRLDSDVYEGDRSMRILDALLKRIDENGYERSAQQLEFHDAFIQACSRVIYKQDWSRHKPDIVSKHMWTDVKSEVCISTPRRFGKTFSIAIFTSMLALACPCEIVIFSPARRASRKLLERILEFIKVAGEENRIIEFNQENLRLRSFINGKSSLIRSFPSKVSVCRFLLKKQKKSKKSKKAQASHKSCCC